jgi:Tol biopolymer transport system component
VLGALGSTLVLAAAGTAQAAPGAAKGLGPTTRISVASDGTQANGYSYGQDANSDGRYIAYESEASNLVANDTNGKQDVFLYDAQSKTTELISVGVGGAPANGVSRGPRLSADGRFIAYDSEASNLVDGDPSNRVDVFVWDRETRTTTRITAGVATGGASADITADGRYVTYHHSHTNGSYQVSIHDRQAKRTFLVSHKADGSAGSGNSGWARVSANGRFITYQSVATDLVAGDTNDEVDVFVYDRAAKTTTRISVTSAGAQGNGGAHDPVISGNGRYVTYHSSASNLVAGDTNESPDVFLYDRQTKQTSAVSVASDGAFGDDMSLSGDLSADGRFVTFWSFATNFDPTDTNANADVYLYDRRKKTTTRISVPKGGGDPHGSGTPTITADGRVVLFSSQVADLVEGDTNNEGDVFVTPRT